MGITKYIRLFTPEDRKRLYLEIEKGKLIRFVVQYEAFVENEWRPIVRWDTAHRYAHKDVLNWRGKVIRKIKLRGVDYKKALKIADEDIEANWGTYKQKFLKGR